MAKFGQFLDVNFTTMIRYRLTTSCKLDIRFVISCRLHHEQGMLSDIQSHFHFHETIIHAIQDEFYALAWAAHRRIHFQFVESKLWINTSYISLCNNVTPQVMSVEL